MTAAIASRAKPGWCGLLSAGGFRAFYLGANVASRFLLEAARMHRPDVILLSAKLDSTPFGVKDGIDVLRAGMDPDPVPPVVVGGQMAIGHPASLRSWGVIPESDAHSMDTLSAMFAVVPSTQ
ncbi:hypothetical protein BH24CHL4_BH24CHL4_17440 [soil metagenome]